MLDGFPFRRHDTRQTKRQAKMLTARDVSVIDECANVAMIDAQTLRNRAP